MKILLDATLEKQIDWQTFRGKLANGHVFAAIFYEKPTEGDFGTNDNLDAQRNAGRAAKLPPRTETPVVGQSVQVEMSPFDMSKGTILLESIPAEPSEENESKP